MTPRTTPEQLAYAIAQDANDIGWQELYSRIAKMVHSYGENCYSSGYTDGRKAQQEEDAIVPPKRKRG